MSDKNKHTMRKRVNAIGRLTPTWRVEDRNIPAKAYREYYDGKQCRRAKAFLSE